MLLAHSDLPLLLLFSPAHGIALFDIENWTCRWKNETNARQAAISPDGRLVATCGDDKTLRVLDSECGRELGICVLQKRISALTFSHDGTTVVVADRFGDVSSVDVENLDQAPKLLFGHVSMLTDCLFMNNDKLLLTSDRDEKIRVTRYPQTEVIHGFLLGHHSSIATLCVPRYAHNIVVSGGADPSVLVWDPVACESLAQLNMEQMLQDADEIMEKTFMVRAIRSMSEKSLVVVAEQSRKAMIIDFDSTANQLYRNHTLSVDKLISSVSVDAEDRIWLGCVDEESRPALFCFQKQGASFESIEVPPLISDAWKSMVSNVPISEVFFLHKEWRKMTEEELQQQREKRKSEMQVNDDEAEKRAKTEGQSE